MSESKELDLVLEGVAGVLGGASSDKVDKALSERRTAWIMEQKALTDFRYFWDSVGRALGGREMVLVDSDTIRGQRNLFFVDPELLRPSIVMPPTRSIPRLPKEEP